MINTFQNEFIEGIVPLDSVNIRNSHSVIAYPTNTFCFENVVSVSTAAYIQVHF